MNSNSGSTVKKTGSRTIFLTHLALLTAIMIIMAFTPLGYLRTPFLSFTLMTVPVAVGGILFGPLAGTYCGFVFGLTSVINAVATGGLMGMLLLINPAGALFTMLIPRILAGYTPAIIYLAFKKHGAKRIGIFVSSLFCPVLNTLLFMTSLVLIFFNSDYIQGLASSLGTTSPLLFITAFAGVQGLIEAMVCFILASLISLTLIHVIKGE